MVLLGLHMNVKMRMLKQLQPLRMQVLSSVDQTRGESMSPVIPS